MRRFGVGLPDLRGSLNRGCAASRLAALLRSEHGAKHRENRLSAHLVVDLLAALLALGVGKPEGDREHSLGTSRLACSADFKSLEHLASAPVRVRDDDRWCGVFHGLDRLS